MEKIEQITQTALTELLEAVPQSPAVTIYAPMHRAATPPNMTEDQIRFKNLVVPRATSSISMAKTSNSLQSSRLNGYING